MAAPRGVVARATALSSRRSSLVASAILCEFGLAGSAPAAPGDCRRVTRECRRGSTHHEPRQSCELPPPPATMGPRLGPRADTAATAVVRWPDDIDSIIVLSVLFARRDPALPPLSRQGRPNGATDLATVIGNRASRWSLHLAGVSLRARHAAASDDPATVEMAGCRLVPWWAGGVGSVCVRPTRDRSWVSREGIPRGSLRRGRRAVADHGAHLVDR
jgi:hypothetical protein